MYVATLCVGATPLVLLPLSSASTSWLLVETVERRDVQETTVKTPPKMRRVTAVTRHMSCATMSALSESATTVNGVANSIVSSSSSTSRDLCSSAPSHATPPPPTTSTSNTASQQTLTTSETAAKAKGRPLPPGSFPNRCVPVLDTFMSYVELVAEGPPNSVLTTTSAGNGAPPATLILLHGNPASSVLWRNVIARLRVKVAPGTRLLAPDLVGHGRSGESSRGLGFFAHSAYLDAWFDAVLAKGERPILVVHDWGSALGFHWCARNESRVRGLVHMESVVAPMESWDEFPLAGRKVFQVMREEKGAGETMVLEKNFFLNRLLLGEKQDWSQEELWAHSQRFTNERSRAPTLAWPREIPIRNTNGPKEVVEAADAYFKFMQQADFPKLFIDAESGFFSPVIRKKTASWKN